MMIMKQTFGHKPLHERVKDFIQELDDLERSRLEEEEEEILEALTQAAAPQHPTQK